jgi:hypothetical protein
MIAEPLWLTYNWAIERSLIDKVLRRILLTLIVNNFDIMDIRNWKYNIAMFLFILLFELVIKPWIFKSSRRTADIAFGFINMLEELYNDF